MKTVCLNYIQYFLNNLWVAYNGKKRTKIVNCLIILCFWFTEIAVKKYQNKRLCKMDRSCVGVGLLAGMELDSSYQVKNQKNLYALFCNYKCHQIFLYNNWLRLKFFVINCKNWSIFFIKKERFTSLSHKMTLTTKDCRVTKISES